MPARKTEKTGKPATALPASMLTGKASAAKAAEGDAPVFAYIASLPEPQRGIAERIDALAAKTLPGLQRAVKWGMSYYGVGDGWCFSCGGFDTHVKLMFINGTALSPVPPVTPVAMGKSTRGGGDRLAEGARRTAGRSVDEAGDRDAWGRGEEAVISSGSMRRGVARLRGRPTVLGAMYTRVLALLTLSLVTACSQPLTRAGAPSRKAVFIILDGIPADVIERVPTPAIDAIAKVGGYARAHVGGELGGATETPTISAPGYMSLLTSTWANKHNVWGNSKLSPNYNYWNIFRIVESVDPSRQTAIFSTWLDNRTVLLGEGRPDAGNLRLDHVEDGFERDTIAFPHDPASNYILAIDERVATGAAAYIAANGPDLSWVYLQHTDDAAHANGDGEGFYAAVRQADAQVGRIWEAIKRRQAMGEEWMIVVTTDHGRDAPTGKGHGGQSVRERTTWIATNQRALGPRWRSGALAIVDITPSILQHLRITIPAAVAQAMEGVSFLQSSAR